jgi:hypothetical protein
MYAHGDGNTGVARTRIRFDDEGDVCETVMEDVNGNAYR